MFTKNKKRTTLLKYWTTRYLFSLCIGLLILGIGSFWWIRQTTIDNRLNLLEYLAAESAETAAGQNNFEDFDRRIDQRSRVLDMGRPPQIFITNKKGVQVRGPHRGPGPEKLKLPEKIFSNNETVQKLRGQYRTDREYRNDLIRWLYDNQSKERRNHLENRLFIVCKHNSGLVSRDNLFLKMDFEQIHKKVDSFLRYSEEKLHKDGLPFNQVRLSNGKSVYSDVIFIN